MPAAFGSILGALDYFGTVVFAASGALLAVRKEMDPVMDAVGLATFTVIGTEVARAAGVSVSIALFMGVMTAAVGGIFRDVLCAQRPLILTGELYVTTSLAGVVVYWLLQVVRGLVEWSAAAAFLVTLILRSAAIRFKIELLKGQITT